MTLLSNRSISILGNYAGELSIVKSDSVVNATKIHQFKNPQAITALARYNTSDGKEVFLVSKKNQGPKSYVGHIYSCAFTFKNSDFVCDEEPFYEVTAENQFVRSIVVDGDGLFIGQNKGDVYHCLLNLPHECKKIVSFSDTTRTLTGIAVDSSRSNLYVSFKSGQLIRCGLDKSNIGNITNNCHIVYARILDLDY